MRMPRPSIMARIIPPKAPLTRTSFGPRLTASTPPVSAPAAMEFHGSSFFRIPTKMQSNVEKSPPHTAKLPPSLGLSLLIDSSAPFILAPGGEFFSPFTRYHTPPPTAPIPKALPQSSSILCGQGSLPWSTGPLAIAVGRLEKKKKEKKTQRLFQASRPPAPSRPSRLSPSPSAHPLACLGARSARTRSAGRWAASLFVLRLRLRFQPNRTPSDGNVVQLFCSTFGLVVGGRGEGQHGRPGG